MSQARIGVMGGTFDPIHYGHLVAANEAAHALGLDEVIFVPTGEPWQKHNFTSGEHRYLMTVIATASNPRFKVSRVDIDRDGPTYTVDTLTDIRAIHPDAELFFITGADAISQLLSWKSVDDVLEMADFVGVTRPGHELNVPETAHGKVTILEIPALAISSTDIRERVNSSKPIWYLLPDGVVQYIAKHELYQESK